MMVSGQLARCLAIVALAALWLLSGCASTTSHTRTDSALVDVTAGLTVLYSRPFAAGTGRGLGEEAADCVTSAIATNVPKARIIAAEHFQRSVFPDLPLESLPVSRESLAILRTDEAFRGRASAAGIRYLIAVGGSTVQPGSRGGGGCGAGPGGGGCVGFWFWERDSMLWAEIVEVTSGESVATVETKVSGRPWFLMAGIFPLGAPSFTETWACHKLGQGVVEALTTQGDRNP